MQPPSLLSGFIFLLLLIVVIIGVDVIDEWFVQRKTKAEETKEPIQPLPVERIKPAADIQSKKYVEPQPPYTKEYGLAMLEASRRFGQQQQSINTLQRARNEQNNSAQNSAGNRANEQDNLAGNQQTKQRKSVLYARVLAYKANEQNEQHKNGNSIICSICSKEFLSVKARSGHMRIHK